MALSGGLRMSKKGFDESPNSEFPVDNVDKTVHNLVFVCDQVWIKLWMENIMSNIT
jgi:hypothetical protein